MESLGSASNPQKDIMTLIQIKEMGKSFNKRLQVTVDPDMPAGNTRCMFDHTGMKKVRRQHETVPSA
jgi:hypothetical protein